jgi:hypothetical protein
LARTGAVNVPGSPSKTIARRSFEHFSYHTGQIAYAVKAGKDIDLGFYRGVDLNRKNQ